MRKKNNFFDDCKYLDANHLCLRCEHIFEAVDICQTTQDTNACEYVCKDMYGGAEYALLDSTGNTRVYASGIKTEDNGSGYNILACPYYLPMNCRAHYAEYLMSNAWRNKRDRQIRTDKFQCQMCGTAKNLQVHHITYANLFDEEPGDLVTLCDKCHQRVHANDAKEVRHHELAG